MLSNLLKSKSDDDLIVVPDPNGVMMPSDSSFDDIMVDVNAIKEMLAGEELEASIIELYLL